MQSVNSPSFLVVVFPTVVFSSLLLLLIRLLTSLAAAVSAQQKNTISVVVKCIYKLYVFSHSVSTSSAECNRCSPPSSLVCGQLLTICDIVWHLPQGPISAARPTSFDRMHSSLLHSSKSLQTNNFSKTALCYSYSCRSVDMTA